jgi:hypothetical protein
MPLLARGWNCGITLKQLLQDPFIPSFLSMDLRTTPRPRRAQDGGHEEETGVWVISQHEASTDLVTLHTGSSPRDSQLTDMATHHVHS